MSKEALQNHTHVWCGPYSVRFPFSVRVINSDAAHRDIAYAQVMVGPHIIITNMLMSVYQ